MRLRSEFFGLAIGLSLAAAGAAQAASCDADAQVGVPQLAAATTVDVAGDRVAAGKSFSVHWKRGPFPGRYPAYLMIAFDKPVRFQGDGFYPLLPHAEAPFGIGRFADETRAVIPYYGRGVPSSGDVTVVPLEAGPLSVRWAVVGHDGCDEIDPEAGSGAASVRVEATGAPEIVVRDFAANEPKSRIFSPAGGRVIQVFNGRYRLVDEASGAQLADRAGKVPRFSPTGRFLAAYSEDGLEIIDTVDGTTVFRDSTGFNLAWDDKDSFAVMDSGAWGAVTVLAPIRKDPVILRGQGGCHACSGTDSTAVKVDLENNVAVFSGDLGVGTASLSVAANATPDNWSSDFDIRTARTKVATFVRRLSQVTDFALPKRWELHGGLHFSNLGSIARGDSGNDPLERFLIKPQMQATGTRTTAAADTVQSVRWRGLSIVREPDANRNILTRLQAFGLPIPAQAIDPAAAATAREALTINKTNEKIFEDADLPKLAAAVKRIKADVPAAKDALVADWQGLGCGPNDDDFQAPKRFGAFQQAFRFQDHDRVLWLTHLQCREGSGGFTLPSLMLLDSQSSAPWMLDMETGDRSASAGNVCYTDISACDLDARLFGGRYLVLASTASRAIEVYDLKTHKNIFKKYNLPRGDLLRQALISLDGKLVLQINSDGSFAGFRVSDAAQLFEGRYVDDEVVLWAPDGRFDATSEGAHYVSLRLPGRVGTYTFAQFSAQLETHGLAGKLLDGSAPAPVTLVSPPSLSGQIEAAGGHLTGTAEASGDTPLSALLVFQDGLLTNRLDPPQAGTHASWNINVDLLPGTRWASLVAVDEKGLASLPMGRDLPAAAPRRVHVLAVGLDHYQDPDIPTLEFGQSDARRFAGALDRIGKNVEIASSRILDEKDATKGGVLKALHETLAAAKPGETVVLFFAGHGVRDTDGTYYLATADTKIADIAGSALPWSDVAAELANQKSRIAVFLDTCHSGAAETDTFSTNDSVAASLLEKVPSGIVVFSAAKGRELSEEAPSVGGGIFTTALVNVIGADRKRFDTNGDGAIEISELYRGVKSAVVADTDGRQTPWIARNQMVGDFALF